MNQLIINKIISIIAIFIIIIISSFFVLSKQSGTNSIIQNNVKGIIDKTDTVSLATIFFNTKNYNKAIIEYEKLLEEGKITPEGFNNLYFSYIYSGNYQEGSNYISSIISQEGPKEEFVGSYISEENISDDIVELQNKLNSKEDKAPKDILAYAKLLYRAGDYYYEMDSQKYSFAIMFHYLNAYLILDKAIELDPNNSELYFYQGRLILEIGNSVPDAQKKLEKAIELKDDDYRYYYRLGNAFKYQKEYELARRTYVSGIRLNDQYEKLYLNIGNMNFKLREKKEGYKNYEKGLKICSEMCENFYYNIGKELLTEQKYIEAKLNIEKSLEINPRKLDSIDVLKQINDKLK